MKTPDHGCTDRYSRDHRHAGLVVNIDCKTCPRSGRYRLARLAAKLGPEMDLDAALAAIAFDCPYKLPGSRVRKYEAHCGIRYPDLDGRQPPPDMPPSAFKLRVVK